MVDGGGFGGGGVVSAWWAHLVHGLYVNARKC